MAALHLPRQLVLAGGGFMPSRAIHVLPPAAVPALVGARLPPGVHAVAAVPATVVVAPGGSGSRAIHLLPCAAVPEPGEPAAEADDGLKGAFVFHDFITTQGLDALLVVDDLVPPTAKAELATKLSEVKAALKSAVVLAGQGSDKMACALEIMRGWYGIVELTHAAYPSPRLPQLPGEQAFLGMCLAPDGQLPPVILDQAVAPLIAPLHVPDADADLVKSVFVAVAVSQAAARAARASYGGNPDN